MAQALAANADAMAKNLEDMGGRLAREFGTLRNLRKWAIDTLDPNHTGLIGVGEFLCVWMRGWDIVGRSRHRHDRRVAKADGTGNSIAAQRAREPCQPAGGVDARQVAAVAACVAARLLKREWELELLDPRGEDDKRRERLWYGRAAEWRWDSARNPAPAHLDKQLAAGTVPPFQFTHTLLVTLRIHFEDYQDVSGGVRFGAVSAYLASVAASPAIGKYFPLCSCDIDQILDTLVEHVRKQLPTGPEWVEPTFPFPTILSLLLKFSTAPPQREALLSHFNQGVLTYQGLVGSELRTRSATAPVHAHDSLLPVRALLSALSSGAGNFFPDVCGDALC